MSTEPLSSRLGFGPLHKVLIFSVDGIGTTHASTAGCYDSLRRGFATSGRLVVPAPWARSAAANYRGEDVGVSLTVLAEHERYRWGPITHAPSLVDGNGAFPSTAEDLWEHADVEEVRRECRAQIERAIFWGFDVSHLDSHLDALHLRPEFFDIELELAIEFGLPLRLPSASSEARIGFPYRRLAAEEGVVVPDHVVEIASPAGSALEIALHNLEPGVTDIRLRPAIDTPELRELHQTPVGWSSAVDQHHALVLEPALTETLKATIDVNQMTVVDYRQLRAVQRS